MPKKIYSQEMIEYLKEVAHGRFNDEITVLFNQKFALNLTESQMKSLRSRYKIRSSIDPKVRGIRANKLKCLFNDEQIRFIENNAEGTSNEALTGLINSKFGTNFTSKQIKGWKKNHKVSSGLTGYFEKGHVPINKGTKGMFNVGGNKTSFKKGKPAQNHKLVGTERIDRNGYMIVKVQDNGPWHKRWCPKHKVEWEKVNGPIPEGHVLIFLDGNKQNITMENLKLITQAQNLQLNRKQWRFEIPEATLAGVQLTQIQSKVENHKKAYTVPASVKQN
ncbi:HNH endonuclease [Enterococcus casseliflavus]|uniref:HNH endonuclease signature motif containing protein n=1 Tax=Enterococcus casseliflavus TaxID=37734 RepID=UPI002DB63EFD|nr:HNH endonuclease signature motif containing protein [Enterococcus casseliflavus]MEB8418472.1 HNH endonuclease [Enterococcus casseliflavus]